MVGSEIQVYRAEKDDPSSCTLLLERVISSRGRTEVVDEGEEDVEEEVEEEEKETETGRKRE